MAQPTSDFRPSLETYQGPLDLLLFLIKRDEVDIFDIPIARIVEQYQFHIEILKEVDPNACGEFLVTAAHLMEVKSRLLLPREELAEDEELEDPRIELVRQLLEYKKYKERALLLEKRIEDHRRRHERPRVDLEGEEVATEGAIHLGNVSIWDLFTAYHKIQLALGAREPHRVVMKDRPIEDFIHDIEVLLGRLPGRSARFEDLFADARSRYEAIGYLLAILELAKERRLSFSQDEIFGPIEVRLHEEEEVRRLIARAAEERAYQGDVAALQLLEGEGKAALAEPAPEAGNRIAEELEELDAEEAAEREELERIRRLAETEVLGGPEGVTPPPPEAEPEPGVS